jgi:Calcineurin-like phosphoesterase
MAIKTFRDPLISVFQSAAADYADRISAGPAVTSANRSQVGGITFVPAEVFLQAADAVGTARATGISPLRADVSERQRSLAGTARTTAEIAANCAGLGFKYLEAIALGDTSSAKRLRGQLESSVCDPRWASTLEAYASYFGVDGHRRVIPYVRPAKTGSRIIEIKPQARIGILGDWGTGNDPARGVLKSLAALEPDYLIHLGDIYYSATSREVQKNFIEIIDTEIRNARPEINIFSLSGNHDMYSGGVAYYEMLRTLNEPPFNQESSFFCLRSGDGAWQFLAMDTGLHDYSPVAVSDALTFIEEDEQEWLLERVREFSGRTILLSHHQLFSAFSRIGPNDPLGQQAYNANLLSTYQALTSTGAKVPAWFWGHEHNLCIYEPYVGLNFGRCLGHGAIPTFLEQNPYDPVKNLVNPPRLIDGTALSHNEAVYANGFALLSLKPDEARSDYFQLLDGQSSKVFSETIR